MFSSTFYVWFRIKILPILVSSYLLLFLSWCAKYWPQNFRSVAVFKCFLRLISDQDPTHTCQFLLVVDGSWIQYGENHLVLCFRTSIWHPVPKRAPCWLWHPVYLKVLHLPDGAIWLPRTPVPRNSRGWVPWWWRCPGREGSLKDMILSRIRILPIPDPKCLYIVSSSGTIFPDPYPVSNPSWEWYISLLSIYTYFFDTFLF